MAILNLRPTAAQMSELAQRFFLAAQRNGFYDESSSFDTQEKRTTGRFARRQAMLISGEVGEAYEAMRKGQIQPDGDSITQAQALHKIGEGAPYFDFYGIHCKGYAAEELADVAIRCYDAAGSIGAQIGTLLPIPDHAKHHDADYWFINILHASTQLGAYLPIQTAPTGVARNFSMYIKEVLQYTYQLADLLQIDLNLHIELKAHYNLLRPYKHGKKF
jgi:NTP pyrophosphatase (non-canonical NTP hydrolase)